MRIVAAFIGIFLLCSPATAQQVDPAAVVLQSRTAYSECVYNSVASQLLQIPAGPARQNADISSLAEQGFLACATEEQVLIGLLASNNVPRQITQTLLLGIQVQIKQTLRDIVANPTKYAAPSAVPATSGGYLVQVASQRSEVDAKAFYRALQDKFPSLLGNRLPLIKRADLGADRIYYRAVVGPFGTSDEALQFCSNLMSAGGQCVVQRN
jgi:SPOR domain